MVRSRCIIARVLSCCLGQGRLQVASGWSVQQLSWCGLHPPAAVQRGATHLASLPAAAALSAAALASWRVMMLTWRCSDSSWACRRFTDVLVSPCNSPHVTSSI